MGLAEKVMRDLKRAEGLLDEEKRGIDELAQEEGEKGRRPSKAIVDALEEARREGGSGEEDSSQDKEQ